MYDKVIIEYKRAITDLSNAFSGEEYQDPGESVTKRIDELFGRLHNLCDYPWDVSGTTLEELAPKDIAKYCCDANSKFSFIFEFLQSLRRKSKVLIVARSPELLRLIHHLTNALQLDCKGAAVDHFDTDREGSDVRVILALTSEELDLSAFDVIIGYDSSFTTSQFLQRSLPKTSNTRQQLVLKLVTTHSIEHIDLRISEQIGDAGETERKNVLVAAIVRARPMVNDPERGAFEPHEIAEIFTRYVNGDEDTISWEAQGVPEDVLDVFMSQPSQSEIPLTLPTLENGRKRKNDFSDDMDPKRTRVRFAQESEHESRRHAHHPPLPDEVRELLEAAAAKQQLTRPGVVVRVPLRILQAIAQQDSEYERIIKDTNLDAQYKATIANLERRVKEYERMSSKIYESNRIALQERTQFEAEKKKAEAALKAATKAAEKEAGVFQKKIQHLQETVIRLTQDPELSDPNDTPLAKSEQLLQEALAKVAALEKRLENSHEDESYVKNAYQDASAAAAAMKSELDSLKALNEELGKKASANAVRIHEIQATNSAINHVRRIEELKTQVRDREAELDRAREELKQLKNGRRETRGVSVPHSPRMGVLSPRVNKGYGSASRGTSPASVAGVEGAGTPFAGQQPGNPRWNHLRE
ncbi:hypothetical protein ESCO_000393 [Escovopsis weberi]|uniref:Uncharacterized protein n=1 Tax=Escovopsis weberi TaxID=150374 RepID=A0A0M9VTZ9_ESCWE|nr:hypothetical protein ESCO_000393 [Escovopsis weberi]